jgi:hypothetical protein
MGTGSVFREVIATEAWNKHSPPSSPEVRNVWSFTTTLSHAFTACKPTSLFYVYQITSNNASSLNAYAPLHVGSSEAETIAVRSDLYSRQEVRTSFSWSIQGKHVLIQEKLRISTSRVHMKLNLFMVHGNTQTKVLRTCLSLIL